jgi:hypothetical protein
VTALQCTAVCCRDTAARVRLQPTAPRAYVSRPVPRCAGVSCCARVPAGTRTGGSACVCSTRRRAPSLCGPTSGGALAGVAAAAAAPLAARNGRRCRLCCARGSGWTAWAGVGASWARAWQATRSLARQRQHRQRHHAAAAAGAAAPARAVAPLPPGSCGPCARVLRAPLHRQRRQQHPQHAQRLLRRLLARQQTAAAAAAAAAMLRRRRRVWARSRRAVAWTAPPVARMARRGLWLWEEWV